MKHKARIAALVAAGMLCGLCACGKQPPEQSADSEPAGISLVKAEHPSPDPALYRAAEIGDTVSFGGFDWYVIGRAEDTETLLCRQSIGIMPYHSEAGDITWENCSLRHWLNSEFYNAFTDEERALIVQTECENPDNTDYIGTVTPGGSTTADAVYLLSLPEAKALPQELLACDRYWWLRSPGKHRYYAAGVYSSGVIDALGYFANYPDYESAVRPALRIRLT